MQVNIVNCLFVLDSEKNDNIRKNDIKKIKVLVTKDRKLLTIKYQGKNMKDNLKSKLKDILGTEVVHLEQVYTFASEDKVDIVYLGVGNISNIKNLDDNFELVDFSVKTNKSVSLGTDLYKYKTIDIEKDNNIEYIHEIEAENNIKETLLYLLTSYKRIRANIDISDIMFKFLPDSFTLEDVRKVYELIKDTSVDKSNFRKKIVKYCEKIETEQDTKNGYRPSQRYRFKALKGDIWL